jgi:tRNA (mo5U34)-methyltransferase
MPGTQMRAMPGLRDRITALGPWFHNMKLGDITTAPDHFLGDYPSIKWRGFAHALPTDLHGCTVLDIGCNAGFYCFEMKRRGADRVVGIDSDPRYLSQAALAAEVTGLSVELRQMSVYKIESLNERFDLILFLGVLYHLRHPLLALDLIREHAAADILVCQCLQRGDSGTALIHEDYRFDETGIFQAAGAPRMQFVEHRFAGDPTNWWIPNAACTQAMLRSAGFQIEQRPEPDIYVCRVTGKAAHGRPQAA